jgi:GNAT superfamily N-acetyltransferase
VSAKNAFHAAAEDATMTDMLVRLYALPDAAAPLARVEAHGVRIRRPEPWEKPVLVDWVRATFSAGWAAECEIAFGARPASCFVAIESDAIVGFACHDCTRKNFFGPTGVAESARGRGIGTALLLACLAAMREDGYAYAIVGGLGPTEFYAKAVGATPIDGSTPGIYDFGVVAKARAGDRG